MRTTRITASPRTSLPSAFPKPPVRRLRRVGLPRPGEGLRLPAPGGRRGGWGLSSRRRDGWHLPGAAGASLLARGWLFDLILLLDVHDHDGDVVVAAGVQGRGEQPSRGPLRVVGGLANDLRDPGLRHHVRESVGAEQQAVARLYGQDGRVHVDLLVRAKGPGDEVLLGMLGGLGPGQVAAAHELRDERVVLGYGLHLAVAHEVGPRVPDVRHLGHGLRLRPPEADGDHRRPHAGELLVAPAGGQDPAVRLPYRLLEGVVGSQVLEHVYGDGARNLPGLEAADAVGDGEEGLVLALADEQGVLVVLADLARVGDAERLELEERHAYSSYLKVVEPTLTVSPSLNGVAPTVLRPLTKVPLVEPRSST